MIEVLLPVYNGEKYIRDQINSILAQSYQDWILKIRNDGSSDNSQTIIEEFCRKYPDKIIQVQSINKNLGLLQSLNILYENPPHGKYIMFSDQDDYWLPDKVKLSYDEMGKLELLNPDKPILICTDAKCVDKDLNILNDSFFEAQRFPNGTLDDVNKMVALNVIQGCTIIMNRAATSQSFPIPTYLNVHDMYLGLKTKTVGVVEYLHLPTLLYRQHSSNELGKIDISIRYYLRQALKSLDTIKMLYELKCTCKQINILKIIFYKFYYAYKRLI